MAGHPDVLQSVAHREVGGMIRVCRQGRLVGELRIEHHVTGVGDAADIDADLEVHQAWYLAHETLETALQVRGGEHLRFGGFAANVPHYDVLDHVTLGVAAGRKAPAAITA